MKKLKSESDFSLKFFTSYFYQVRFFKPNQLPISTALWDPKWFHDNKGQDYAFKDKRGIWNGIRCSRLAPGPTCENLCRGKEGCGDSPEHCRFLMAYRKQLNNLDFNQFIKDVEKIVAAAGLNPDEAEVILLVHEKYDNPCSERNALLNWLNDNGIKAKELEYPIK